MRPWFRNFLTAVLSLAIAYFLAFATIDVAEAVLVHFQPPETQIVDTRDFGAQIGEIDDRFPTEKERIGEITHVLDHVPAFNKLAFSGGDLVDQALTYLAEAGHTPLQRRIAIHAVQKVPVSEWSRFAEKMLDRYQEGQIDPWELYDAIFPRRFYSVHTEADALRPSVRHVLYRVLFGKNIDWDWRQRALFDLSGIETLSYYLDPCIRCF